MSKDEQKGDSQDYCETNSGKWIKTVRSIIANLEFGEVHLTVHRGKVVEVRRIEKIRLEQSSDGNSDSQNNPPRRG